MDFSRPLWDLISWMVVVTAVESEQAYFRKCSGRLKVVDSLCRILK